ncbi:MAG: hypothetical protein IJ448_03290 [Oscillospiraceae bacterium]|nr:hypothetical protein [Oscillospiraceae bacterium]
MRILQCYRFLVGTKIPFDKWPGIIEEFLHRQNLSHRIFHYCLETYDVSDRCRGVLDGTECKTCSASNFFCERCRKEAAATLRKGTACERALKENPFLGPIKVRQTRYKTIQSLNNFDQESNNSKEDIYAIVSKIYRRYGFAETSLIYRDIDFFSRRVFTPAPKTEDLLNGYEGSGITLYRSCLSEDNAIILTVESYYPGDVQDAIPYANALGELLPGIKRLSATKIIMENDEQARYEELHRQAKPLVQQANDFFADHMPDEKGNGEPDTRVSVASWLKKFSKRYGYTYLGYDNFIYFLKKRLANGHYICLEFVSEPNNPGADPGVYLCGLGFRYEIWYDGFYPQNPHDASDYFTRLFDVLAEVEQTVFSAVLDLYPTTPGWFVPTILG